jgi:hypothetical protein
VEMGRTGEEQVRPINIGCNIGLVLHFLTDVGEWQVEADSSDHATGTCLMQCQNGVWVPIVFMSKGLNDTERNYDIHWRLCGPSTSGDTICGAVN